MTLEFLLWKPPVHKELIMKPRFLDPIEHFFVKHAIKLFVLDPITTSSNEETFLQEEKASELWQILFKEMFLRYYMHSDVFSMFISSNHT